MIRTAVRSRPFFQLLVCLLLAVSCATAQQPQKQMQLERLEFDGLKRYSREQIAAATELRIGQVVNESLLDEAANRLVQTCFFTNVTYRLRAGGGQATVTFRVEEKVDKGLPVVFDNFVWFNEVELANFIRRELPSYDGYVLNTGNIATGIKTILQHLLDERKIPGFVEYMLSADPSGAEAAHVYTIKGISIPICQVDFTGAGAISDDELRQNSKPIFNDDYSRGIVVGFANTALGDLYRQRGYLRARFTGATVKTRNDTDCKNGVAVTLAVEEGLQYAWDKAEWIENKALSAQELDSALGMKQGEVASITKITRGLHEVSIAFGTKGYLAATLRPMRDFNDEKRSVTFRFRVIEGGQYKMGALSFVGISDKIAAHLKSQWKLSPGDVYDASYVEEFLSTVVARDVSLAQARAGKAVGIDSSVKPDRKTLTVNVTITFK